MTSFDVTELLDGSIRLRALTSDDAERVVRWRSSSDVASWMFGAPPTPDGHRAWVARAAASGDRQEWMIEHDGAAVGTVGLSEIDRSHGRAELGIVLGEPSARGAGVATRACRLVIDHAFDDLGLTRIYLQMHSGNDAARSLYRRLGFVEEGVLRQHVVRDGVAADVVVMGLLAIERQERATR